MQRRSKLARDPATPQEWQQAVDCVAFMLLLDVCRQYGLVEGGPTLRPQRCVEILTKGEALGYLPMPVDQLITRVVQ